MAYVVAAEPRLLAEQRRDRVRVDHRDPAAPMSDTSPMWPASVAQLADWQRLAGAWGSSRHDLALREASGEPPVHAPVAEVYATLFST